MYCPIMTNAGTFVPMMELSFSGPFVPWNFRSRYLSCRDPADHSFICQQSSTWSSYKEGTRNKQKRGPIWQPPCTAAIHTQSTEGI